MVFSTTFAVFFCVSFFQAECVSVGNTASEEAVSAGNVDCAAGKRASCDVDVKDLDGRIIYFESEFRNRDWLGSQDEYTFSGKYFAGFPATHIDEVVNHLELKWLITDVGNGEITLQNMDGSYNFLHIREVELPNVGSITCKEFEELNPAMATTEYASNPAGSAISRFTLKCMGNDVVLSQVFKNKERYVSNICRFATTLDYTTYAPLSVYVPPKDDSFVAIATLDNSGRNNTVTYEYSEEIGMSQTNGQEVSESLEVTLGLEIKGALSVGTSHSSTWASASSDTYSRVVTHTVTVEVGPYEKLQVQQLLGTYGNYQTGARCFKFIDMSSAPNVREAMKIVYASSVADYKCGKVRKNDC